MKHVLRRSAPACAAIQHLLRGFGIAVPETITYKNQGADADGAIPDLVGFDDAGVQRVIIEAKFWAELTANQLVTYLSRLPDRDGVLIVVAPAQRLTLLRGELLRRCKHAGLTIAEGQPGLDETLLASVDPTSCSRYRGGRCSQAFEAGLKPPTIGPAVTTSLRCRACASRWTPTRSYRCPPRT